MEKLLENRVVFFVFSAFFGLVALGIVLFSSGIAFVSVIQALSLLSVIVVSGWLLVVARVKGRSDSLSFRGTRAPVGSVVGRVSSLYSYPVKSAHGVSHSTAQLDSCGIVGDRLLMITNAKYMRQSQLHLPYLSCIQSNWVDCEERAEPGGVLKLSAEGMPDLLLTVNKTLEATRKSVKVNVIVTDAECVDLGEEASVWLDTALDRAECLAKGEQVGSKPELRSSRGLRVLAMKVDQFRFVKDFPLYFGAGASAQDRTKLQDYGLFLLSSTASLADLQSHMETSEPLIPMNRFRSNIVIEGSQAWEEDEWQTIRIGSVEKGVVFRSHAPCIRCLIPTVDQETGESGFRKSVKTAQPTAALRRFRPGALRRSFTGLLPVSLGGAGGIAPHFGSLLTYDNGSNFSDPFSYSLGPKGQSQAERLGRIAVGDSVTVLAYHSPTFIQRIFGI